MKPANFAFAITIALLTSCSLHQNTLLKSDSQKKIVLPDEFLKALRTDDPLVIKLEKSGSMPPDKSKPITIPDRAWCHDCDIFDVCDNHQHCHPEVICYDLPCK